MGTFAAIWGIVGVTLLIGSAVGRLAPIAARALISPLLPIHWAALAVVVGGMAYLEGYRGFQLGFSPRVAARARHLYDHPTPLRALLAPFFCMSYFGAPPRRQLTSLGVTLAVVALVIGVRYVQQPWRGIIDAGVVVGLTWGLVAMLIFTARAFSRRGLKHPTEVKG